MQRFHKDTLDRLPELLDQLLLPTIRRKADVYVVDRLYRKRIVRELFVNGESNGYWYKSLESDDHEGRPDSLCTTHKDPNCETSENHQAVPDEPTSLLTEAHTACTHETTTTNSDYSSTTNLDGLMQKMELEPNKGFNWPTKAADVITLYEGVWHKDYKRVKQMVEAKRFETPEHLYKEPHSYWNLTQMCRPYTHVNPDGLACRSTIRKSLSGMNIPTAVPNADPTLVQIQTVTRHSHRTLEE
jgi:hypothetical protein